MLGGAKITDLFLAEKNLVDFVDKNLGQEWDRLKQDELEMDSVCNHLVGGTLDYPFMISHDFCDITTAWDIYMHAFTRDIRKVMPKRFGFGVNDKPPFKNDRWNKMPFRGDELTQKQFANAVCVCGPKIRKHLVDCMLECTQSGRLENLYPIISNIVVIRNYIWNFQQLFDAESRSKLKPEYKEFSDLVEVMSEQMLQVQANLLLTYIVHDEDSQNWKSYRLYYEGERGSPTVQMWSYFLKSMQRDMWRIMPPQLAQRIFGILVSDSLAVLASRYSKIKPCETGSPQFVCDIVNILTTVEELLFYISTDLTLVCDEAEPTVSKSIHSIHLKCQFLVSSLIIVGCPLEILYKSFRRGLSSCALMTKKPMNSLRLSQPIWMEIIKCLSAKFYPAALSQTNWELLSTLKLLCRQPAPHWPLVYQVVTMAECKVASFILTLFPTIVAPVMDFMLEGKTFHRCGNASCMSADCHSLVKSLPNHYASACALYIVAHGTPRHVLVQAYRPVLSRIVDWSVMDRTQMWNSKSRPVWFQSMIDLLLPILKTCVQSLCLSILAMDPPLNPKEMPSESQEVAQSQKQNQKQKQKQNVKPKAKEVPVYKPKPKIDPEQIKLRQERLTQLVAELLNGLTDILSVIPRGFFLVCEEMDDMIPPSYQPVRNNVPVHFLVTALYMLLSLGPKIVFIPPPPPQPPEETTTSATSANQPSATVATVSVPVPVTGKHSGSGTVLGHGSTGSKPLVQSVNKVISEEDERKRVLEPVLLSVAERLCHLDDPAFDQSIHRLVTQIESMMKQMETQAKSKASSFAARMEYLDDYACQWDMANLKADFLLNQVEGQLALRIVYWFIITHEDLLERMITGNLKNSSSDGRTNSKHSSTSSKIPNGNLPSGTGTNSTPVTIPTTSVAPASNSGGSNAQNQNSAANTLVSNQNPNPTQPMSFSHVAKLNLNLLKLAPRTRTYDRSPNIIHEFHYVNKHRLFDEIIWNQEDHMDWVTTVRCCKLGLHKAFVSKLLERRWEFQQQNQSQSQSDGATEGSEFIGAIAESSLSSEQKSFTHKMVEEIKALMMS